MYWTIERMVNCTSLRKMLGLGLHLWKLRVLQSQYLHRCCTWPFEHQEFYNESYISENNRKANSRHLPYMHMHISYHLKKLGYYFHVINNARCKFLVYNLCMHPWIMTHNNYSPWPSCRVVKNSNGPVMRVITAVGTFVYGTNHLIPSNWYIPIRHQLAIKPYTQ